MHIKNNMINKELRFRGIVIRTLLPFYTKNIFKIRNKIMAKFMKGRCKTNINYEQKWISRPDGSEMRVCIYSPKSPKDNVPGLLWIHGGGYALGVPEQSEPFIKRFVDAGNCIVVSPDYRHSIDHPYPAAFDDCWTALLWLRDHCDDYKIRSDQLMVGGDSAGGGLTAALSLYARDKNEVAIAFQMPLYPMLDDRMNTESAKDNDAPVWNSKTNYLAWKLYLGDLFETDNAPVYAAPARASDFTNLPPTLSFVGNIEPFRDETIIYMNKLRESGVLTFFEIYEGCFHAFDVIGRNTDLTKKAVAFLMENYNYAVEHYFAQQPITGAVGKFL
jgi:acetyl esterase/lipase